MINYKTSDILLYNTDDDLLDLDIELLFYMINFKIKNYEYSLKYIDKFLENKNFSIYKYYYAVRDYTYFKNQKYVNEDIDSFLTIKYGQDTAKEIIDDLGDSEKIFDNYEWTSCFYCEQCKLIESCRYFDILSIIKKLHDKYALFIPHYSKLLL